MKYDRTQISISTTIWLVLSGIVIHFMYRHGGATPDFWEASTLIVTGIGLTMVALGFFDPSGDYPEYLLR